MLLDIAKGFVPALLGDALRRPRSPACSPAARRCSGTGGRCSWASRKGGKTVATCGRRLPRPSRRVVGRDRLARLDRRLRRSSATRRSPRSSRRSRCRSLAVAARRAVAGDRLRGAGGARRCSSCTARTSAGCAPGPRTASALRRRARLAPLALSQSRSSVWRAGGASPVELARAARRRCRSARRRTSCVWIVSRLTCRESRKSSVVELRVAPRACRAARPAPSPRRSAAAGARARRRTARRAASAARRPASSSSPRRSRTSSPRSAAASVPTKSVPRPRWLWVASGTSSRIRSTSSSSKPASSEPLGRAPAHEPLRARAGVDPGRLDADEPSHAALAEAAAIPISETISWVASPVTGVRRSSG